MKQPRLAALLAAMTGLGVLRVSVPPSSDPQPLVAEAVQRVPASSAVSAEGSLDGGQAGGSPAVQYLPGGLRVLDIDEARDAFAVRKPPAAPAPPVPISRPKQAVEPPAPPPLPPTPPPPPFTVMGSWSDERGHGVFLSGPRGVLLGRTDDVLLSDYKVIRVTSQQVHMRQITSARDFTLAIPAVPASPASESK